MVKVNVLEERIFTKWDSLNKDKQNEWVAEAVMHWRRGNPKRGEYSWISPTGDYFMSVPNYCTDYNLTMTVAETLRKRFYQVEISLFKDDYPAITVWENDITPAYSSADWNKDLTVQECICLIALMVEKAVKE
ncbi:MAG: Phage sandwich domain [Firmicutes bacterium]|nr:Phage sandwich domain [Bacillota bacterium]